MSVLSIRRAGPQTSLQDGGRTGFLRYGVSESGPMDWFSHALANRLAGNTVGTAAIEFGLGGLEVQALEGPMAFAAAGPALRGEWHESTYQKAFAGTLAPGEVLKLTIEAKALWAYLAMSGGLSLKPVLRSLATNRRTGLGPMGDLNGAKLSVKPPMRALAAQAYDHPLEPAAKQPIGLIQGPQEDMFAADQLAAMVERVWRVSARIDRMGYRLDGEPLRHAKGSDIVSDGIVLGAVQVPGDGLPTVLMADRQPTGGYPKIATVTRADLPRLAQSPPGTKLRFRWTETQAAVAELRQLSALLDNPKPAGPRIPTSEELLALNLIDGAVAETPEA